MFCVFLQNEISCYKDTSLTNIVTVIKNILMDFAYLILISSKCTNVVVKDYDHYKRVIFTSP